MRSWIPDARNFAYLTWKQVDALPRDKTVLVLPTAAIEQHGQHLPLATDTLINSILLGAALARLPLETPVYVLPAICYGKSNEHIGFPGTLSVSASTFMAVVRDLGSSIASSGFKKLVLYNTHGGNSSLVGSGSFRSLAPVVLPSPGWASRSARMAFTRVKSRPHFC
jgi:creatinine amidohydrolase